MRSSRAGYFRNGWPHLGDLLRLLSPLMMCLFLPSSAAASSAESAAATSAVEVMLRLSPQGDRLSGTLSLPVAPGQEAQMLLLFPQALATRPEALNDINHRWIYPGPFEPAGLELHAVELVTALGTSIPVKSDMTAETTRQRLSWPKLPEGQAGVLRVPFETRLPQRFGTFGRVGAQWTLEGGGFPLPLDDSGALHRRPYRVRLEGLPSSAQARLGGEPLTHSEGAWQGEGRFEVPSLRFGVGWHSEQCEQAGQPPVRLEGMPWLGEARAALFCSVVTGALETLLEQYPALSEHVPPLLFVQAPLRESLTAPVEGMVLVSDRLFRVSALFRSLHALELQFRLYEQVLRSALRAQAQIGADALAEGLAFQLALALQSEEERANSLEQRLGWLTVIPIIDRLLHNPNFPYGATYAKARHRPDVFRQRVSSLLPAEPSGTVAVERLRARLGDARFWELVRASLAGGEGRSWRAQLAALAPDALGFWDAWWVPFTPPNYQVGEWEIQASGAGYETRLEVLRQGHGPPEPVTIRLEGRGGKQLEVVLAPETQAGAGTAGQAIAVETSSAEGEQAGDEAARLGPLQVLTAFKPVRLSLDPRGALDESSRTDNEDPPRYNWLIWDMLFNYNGSSQAVEEGCSDCGSTPDRFVAFLLNLRYKDTLLERHVWELEAFRQEESFGGAFGYAHYFGKKRTVYRWEHELAARLEYRNLRQAFEVEQTVGSFESLDAAVTLRGGYTYENRLNPYTPVKGLALDFKGLVGWGLDTTGAETGSFGALSLQARRLFPVNEVLGVAARLKAETFLWGEQVPVMNGFLMGGYGELRSLAPRALVSESKVLGSVELRHPIWLDLDLNVVLFRIREARGVMLLDVGAAGARFFKGLGENGVRAGLGYGLRLNMDLFGLSPLLCAVDVVVPVEGAFGGQGVDLSATRVLVGSYHGF
ncbi:MAG: BamA/TamA family outer membrane protein [Myxococcota bacterium]